MAKPKTQSSSSRDAALIRSAQEVLSGKSKKNALARLVPFIGPAIIASVAYMDPGNFATNIEGGAKFGYELLWVILASNLMAMLLQSLSAKLGIASGKNLAEHCREQFPRWLVWIMWVVAELAAMATDLAEFIGAALGFNLLFGLPLFWAGVLTAAVTFVILALERYGFRPVEAAISAFVGVVAISYLIEILIVKPPVGTVLYHLVTPHFSNAESVLVATGILGATVMPHAIYLHSALTQNRIVTRNPRKQRLLFRYELLDVFIAMGAAGLINMAMLIMAAATFHTVGLTNIGTLEQAHRTLQPLLGRAAQWFFGISLLASGLSSSSVGTMAGQVIMQGFIHRHIPPWVRRLVTILPSLIVIGVGADPTQTLILSQVVLSFALPFAVIPLIFFTRRRDLMGALVNRPLTTALAALAGGLILALNAFLIYRLLLGA